MSKWREYQSSHGLISTLSARKKEIWDSGINSILALLQTDVEAEKIQELVEKKVIDGAKRVAGLVLLKDLIRLSPSKDAIVQPISWFTTAMRANNSNLTHYLDDLKGIGTHMEVQAAKAFFAIIEKIVEMLRDSEDKDQALILLDALQWNYSATNHGSLAKLNLFTILHRGNGKPGNIIKRCWGKPRPELICKSYEKTLTEGCFDAFEMLFTLVTARIVQSDFGEEININKKKDSGLTTMVRAKSIVDENASELLLGQAFDVIFREIKRYATILDAFEGIDWEAYARQRNEDRKESNEWIKPVWMAEVDDLLDQCEDELDPDDVPTIEIVSATYGTKDVADKLKELYESDAKERVFPATDEKWDGAEGAKVLAVTYKIIWSKDDDDDDKK
jgi:hypothetical protein